jgi:hypothetical protein
LKGCVPLFSEIDETAAGNATINLLGIGIIHRAVIDGEVISFAGTIPNAVNDGASPPTAGAAGTDKPFFIYLVGGRHNPLRNTDGCPFLLIASATGPDDFGHPVSALTLPASVGSGSALAGALYIGIGFTYSGSTSKKSCRIAGDWVHAMSGGTTVGIFKPLGFNEPARTIGSVFLGVTAQTLATRPSFISLADVVLLGAQTAGAVPNTLSLHLNITPGTIAAPLIVSCNLKVLNELYVRHARIPLRVSGADLLTGDMPAGGNTYSVFIMATAYNMRVPRLSES